MEENNNFILFNALAMRCLNREEYADFLTVMQKIRDRSISVLEHLKENDNNIDEIRYPHDIELTLQYKIFQNNQIGQRIKLSEYAEVPLLIKVPLDKEPNNILKDIYNYIAGINK